jgi:protein-disulfide isomerase
VGIASLVAALVSIAVGEGGPESQDIGGVNPVQQLFGGIAQEDATLGSDDAETTVTVFNDLQCEPCRDFELDVVDTLVERYARTGAARLEFRHFSLAPNDTTLSAIAAEAAGEQGRQWQYVDTFFRNQELGKGEIDEELLRKVAEAIPLLDVDQWESDFESPEAEARVREDAMLASELELPAQPAIVVSGPGVQRMLIETPSLEEVEAAIAEVEAAD